MAQSLYLVRITPAEMESTSKQSLRSPNWTDSRVVPIKVLRSQHNEHRHPEPIKTLIGESEIMQDLKRSIRTVATSSETVLITGESGTGKELIAHAVHDLSLRRSQPFVAVNCGSLTESLLESELFGHVKGSFTGATTNKKGFFEAAGHGTIFLDEFAEMSLSTQARLLRVLEERTVRPVGLTEAKEIALSARVVVATNHDLKHDVSEGKFRKDLYYRVNVLEINAPALRHRFDDILPLAQHFIRRYNKKNPRAISEHIAPHVLAILEAYSWPGNVRELENITKRLALRAEEEGITEADVRSVPELDQPSPKPPLQCVELTEQHQLSTPLHCLSTGAKEQCQCRCIEELDLYRRRVDQAGGSVAEAARQLNIPRNTLRRRMSKLESRCAR